MLKCWDSDPEDRPSFTKIGSTISRALETMSEYVDISLVSDDAKVHIQAMEDGTRHKLRVVLIMPTKMLHRLDPHLCQLTTTQSFCIGGKS